jgi:hypothetical protein
MEIFLAADTEAVTPDWRVLVYGLLAGFLAAVIVSAFLWQEARKDKRAELPGGAQWKFTDSWASNLTAITAAFAALLAAFSGKLDTVIPAGVSATFAVSSALYVAIAACAPIAYTVGQRMKPSEVDAAEKATPAGEEGEQAEDPMRNLEGSRRGLVVAAGLTLLSVFSSLGSVAVVLLFGVKGVDHDVRWATLIIPLAIGALVAAYAVRTIRWLLTPRAEGAALPGITGIVCCESRPDQVAHRVFLL